MEQPPKYNEFEKAISLPMWDITNELRSFINKHRYFIEYGTLQIILPIRRHMYVNMLYNNPADCPNFDVAHYDCTPDVIWLNSFYDSCNILIRVNGKQVSLLIKRERTSRYSNIQTIFMPDTLWDKMIDFFTFTNTTNH